MDTTESKTTPQDLRSLNLSHDELLCVISSLLSVFDMEVVKEDFGNRASIKVVKRT